MRVQNWGKGMFKAFIHGFLLALGLILPLGVQNVFIFNQGANRPDFRQAIPAIVVAALCDTLLILLAVLGVSVLVLKLSWLRHTLTWVGIVFLGYMGWVTWRSQPGGEADQDQSDWSLKRLILFTASISLLNPHAILDTIGVIGTSSLQYNGTAKIAFTTACIIVSWVWFLSLATFGRVLRTADATGRARLVLNKVSAVIIWASAGYLLVGR